MPLKSALLVAASLLALSMPAAASDYYFRSKPVVSPPQPISIAAKPGTTPGQAAESDPAAVRGYKGDTASIVGGEYQVCSTSSCADQNGNWRTAPTPNLPDEFWVRVRVTPTGYGTTARATLTIGGNQVVFEATSRAKDETPAAVTFATKSGQTAGAVVTSDVVQLRDHDGVSVSVSGGASYRVCPDSACSGSPAFTSASGTAAPGAWIQLRQTAPAAGQGQNASLSYGTLSATWRVESAAAATCSGTYVRVRSSYGYEALLCGVSSLPSNVEAMIYDGGMPNYYRVMLRARTYDSCNYSVGASIGGETGEARGFGFSSWGQTSSCSSLNGTQIWNMATGNAPIPSQVIIRSIGSAPSTSLSYASASSYLTFSQ